MNQLSPDFHEPLTDFINTSREVYIRAFEREYGESIPPSLEGKPLDALSFDAEATMPDPDNLERGLDIRHKLHVGVNYLFPESLEGEHPLLDTLPDDIRAFRTEQAARVLGTKITRGLVLADALPIGTSHASYSEISLENGILVSAPQDVQGRSFTLEDIAKAQDFANESLTYVESTTFNAKSPAERRLLHAIFADTGRDITHQFRLEFRPGMELNGHESSTWLAHYAAAMLERSQRAQAVVDRLVKSDEELPMSDSIRDLLLTGKGGAEDRADELRYSYNRAMKLLRDRD